MSEHLSASAIGGIAKAPILAPVELSDGAVEVVTIAAEIAGCQDRPLVVLHVVNGNIEHNEDDVDELDLHPSLSIADRADRQLQKTLSDLAEERPDLSPLREARVILVRGIPSLRILEVAENEGADMIVMGSHGRKGAARVLMGSVAESVARRCEVPVTIVKAKSRAAKTSS